MLLSAPAGLAAGYIAWLLAGGPDAAEKIIGPLEAELVRFSPPRASAAVTNSRYVVMPEQPIFILSSGPHAVPAPVVRLEGVSRTRARQAALVSINDRPAEWLTVGEVRDGVTIQAVQAGKVVVDTVFGPQEVALGARIGAPASPASPPSGAGPAPTPAPSGAPGALEPTIVDRPPPGFRSPPPPASAPGVRP